jgi:superfamily II DNA or RNA helicase
MTEAAYEMREYQSRIIGNVQKEFAKVQRTLAVAATGTGKTVIFSTIAKDFLSRGRVLVLAHRDELIQQACAKLRAITGILPTVEKADQYSNEESIHGPPPLVVSSIQTQQTGRMNRFKPKDFSLVIADEAHHACAKSWESVLSYYGSNPNCKILGVTATPDRADGEMLGKIFESVADSYTLIDAVEDGYLVPVRPHTVEIEGLDFSRIHTLAGDFNAGELEEAMMFEEPLHGVAYATIEIACGLETGTLRDLLNDADRAAKLAEILAGKAPQKALIFCVSVAHAERMAEILNRWIPESAEVVSGKLADETRAARLKAFKKGQLRFLCNCMIATEGFDEPSIEIVVMARPTKSRSLFAQMLGRGTRPLEDIAHLLGTLATPDARCAMIEQSPKPYLKVLDFVGNAGRHEIVSAVDIFGEGYEPSEIARAKEIAASGKVDARKALEQSREEVEKKRREAEIRKKEREEKLRRQAELAGRQGLVAAASYSARPIDEWEIPPEGILAKHVNILKKAKVPPKDVAGWPPEKVGQLCRKIVMHWQMGLCSYKQARCLQRAGWKREELERMTFETASKTIDALARNGWRKPILIGDAHAA